MVSKRERLNQAFEVLPRELFLPEEIRHQADADRPIPIGYGQTNSQPSLVRQMLGWLDVRRGDKVLDVGSGSGWTSALLDYLVEPGGKVFAVEKVPQLLSYGKENVRGVGITGVRFFEAGDKFGLPQHAPYDRILVSASATELPQELVGQLKSGGKMVVPVKNDILEITKDGPGELRIQRHEGFAFVPLVK